MNTAVLALIRRRRTGLAPVSAHLAPQDDAVILVHDASVVFELTCKRYGRAARSAGTLSLTPRDRLARPI